MNSTVSVSSSAGTSRPRGFLQRGDGLPVLSRPLAPPLVDQPPLGRLDQPATRARRDAIAGPVHRCGDQRLLDGILGGVEVAVSAGDHAEDLRRKLAQQDLDIGLPAHARGAHSSRTWIGCSSAVPPGPGTAEYRAAISIARSSDSTSTVM